MPRQRIETDYYAVEHLRYYEKQVIPEKSIEYVPVVRTFKRTEFVPVERYLFDDEGKLSITPKTSIWIRPKTVNQ